MTQQQIHLEMCANGYDFQWEINGPPNTEIAKIYSYANVETTNQPPVVLIYEYKTEDRRSFFALMSSGMVGHLLPKRAGLVAK